MASYKRSEITKDHILEAASKLFLEKGYTQTTIRDICKESGVSLSRVNYHFSSKADLAKSICRTLLRNFYTELKNALKNERGYSLVTEAISLRFIVDLVLEGSDKPQACTFYRECANEGLLGDVFNQGDHGLFQAYMDEGKIANTELLSKKLGVYSYIFGSSLPAINKGWYDVLGKCNGNKVEAEKIIQDVFASLFMQMMDIPHDAQQAMVEISYAYYKTIHIDLISLTDVSISVPEILSLKQKVNIVEPLFEGKEIKLKSTGDRASIDLDTEMSSYKESKKERK